MSTIRILPDQVANRIAAGEVIERPVAVVKELVDNSIDAQSTEIRIQFAKGGKSLIRVEDNGVGMTPDDALLCLERHATSKIESSEDLFNIRTLGFRGEAVPSIASVSRFLLQTRTKEETEGTEILVNGGKLIHRKAVGTPVGTRIEVSHLFSSIPVRRKFLKTDNTEASHIVQWVRLMAIAHPGIRFRLQSGNKPLFSLPKDQSLLDRVESLWGKSVAQDLIEINFKNDYLKARGYVGKAGVSRPSRQDIVTIVNGRPVESRTLGFAFTEAFHTHIPRGRYPIVFIHLEIDPSAIDVNIHPSKKQIKFKDDGAVRTLVIQSVWKLLRGDLPTTPQAESTVSPRSSLPVFPSVEPVVSKEDATQTSSPSPIPDIQPTPLNSQPSPIAMIPEHSVAAPKVASSTEPVRQSVIEREWRFIGSYARAFSLYERSTGLCLVHSSRAKKRIAYESMLNGLQQGVDSVQQEIVPIVFELDIQRSQKLKSWLSTLRNCGIEVEEFGRNFFRLESSPALVKSEEVKAYLMDQLDLLKHTLPSVSEIWQALALMHCEAVAHRVELPLQKESAQDLLAHLLICDQPLVDPLGKRIICDLPHRVLDPSL